MKQGGGGLERCDGRGGGRGRTSFGLLEARDDTGVRLEDTFAELGNVVHKIVVQLNRQTSSARNTIPVAHNHIPG